MVIVADTERVVADARAIVAAGDEYGDRVAFRIAQHLVVAMDVIARLTKERDIANFAVETGDALLKEATAERNAARETGVQWEAFAREARALAREACDLAVDMRLEATRPEPAYAKAHARIAEIRAKVAS